LVATTLDTEIMGGLAVILKRIVPPLGSLSSAAVAVFVGGRTGLWVVCSLLALFFVLIAILALTGTFGCDTTRPNAQTVLAILLGRDWVINDGQHAGADAIAPSAARGWPPNTPLGLPAVAANSARTSPAPERGTKRHDICGQTEPPNLRRDDQRRSLSGGDGWAMRRSLKAVAPVKIRSGLRVK
jgi:hypothetical protein